MKQHTTPLIASAYDDFVAEVKRGLYTLESLLFYQMEQPHALYNDNPNVILEAKTRMLQTQQENSDWESISNSDRIAFIAEAATEFKNHILEEVAKNPGKTILIGLYTICPLSSAKPSGDPKATVGDYIHGNNFRRMNGLIEKTLSLKVRFDLKVLQKDVTGPELSINDEVIVQGKLGRIIGVTTDDKPSQGLGREYNVFFFETGAIELIAHKYLANLTQ